MYRIRFHGRGGQGIKTSSRILGTAFFNEGFDVQDAPVYGAERRGAPMFAYVRAARLPIQERGVINHPDLVVVADESLMPIPAANILLGVTARTVLLLNSPASVAEWRRRLNTPGPILVLAAGGDVESYAEMSYVGATCAGAAARLVGRITRDSLARAIRDELRDYSGEVVGRNLQRALRAYDVVGAHANIVPEGTEIAARGYVPPEWIDVPFDAASLSAPDIRVPATSELTRTGAWRTMRPVIDPARCNGCTWVCSTMCPDSAIRVTSDGRPEIDYDHCKGCLVCVAVCPPHAISAVPESTGTREPS